MYRLTLQVDFDDECDGDFENVRATLNGLVRVLDGSVGVSDVALTSLYPSGMEDHDPYEWADEMAHRICDDAGYDDNTYNALARTLSHSPSLDLLIGTDVIESEYFNKEG